MSLLYYATDMSLNVTNLRLQLQLPGANELTQSYQNLAKSLYQYDNLGLQAIACKQLLSLSDARTPSISHTGTIIFDMWPGCMANHAEWKINEDRSILSQKGQGHNILGPLLL